jgi:hypothetical protein
MAKKTQMYVDYSLWKAKSELLRTQLMPFAKITGRQVAEVALEMIKDRTPTTQTGTDIRSMWEMKESRQKTREVFIIQNTYEPNQVILFFEEGTVPHEIRGTKWPLHFWWLGKEIYAWHVSHPGTPAYRMIDQTEEYIKPKMDWWERQQYNMVGKIMGKRKA